MEQSAAYAAEARQLRMLAVWGPERLGFGAALGG